MSRLNTASFSLAALLSAAALSGVAAGGIIVSEVHPSGSGNAPYAADFFEITNTGTSAVNITGWRFDDNSNSFGSAVALTGITSIPAGASVIFLESATPATTIAAFINAWFGGTAPAGLQIGSYTGSGVGLSTGGDAVNIFDSAGARVTGVQFGASTANVTFDNAAGIGGTTLPLPVISQLSVIGTNGVFGSTGTPTEVGSPGVIPTPGAAALLGLGAMGMARRNRRSAR